jgi:hypothetical protein
VPANGPRPGYSHPDGEPLCPVIGPHGYRPADPVQVEAVHIVLSGTLLFVFDDPESADIQHAVLTRANLNTDAVELTPQVWETRKADLLDTVPTVTIIDARQGRDLGATEHHDSPTDSGAGPHRPAPDSTTS